MKMYVCIYIYLNYFAIQQKIINYKSTIIKLKIKKLVT